MRILVKQNPLPAARFMNKYWKRYHQTKDSLAQELRLHLNANANILRQIKGSVMTVEDRLDPQFLPMTAKVKLTAVFNRETNRYCDLDNLLKMAMDFLQTAYVLYNDDQVRSIEAKLNKVKVGEGSFELIIEPESNDSL